MEKRTTFAVSALFLGVIFGLAIAVAVAQNAPAGQRGGGAAVTPPCGPNLPAEIKNVAKDSRCFELRTYTVREGSSLDLLHSRFRDHTTALFKKHGMSIIGYWQPVAKRDTLVYLLAYKDGAARDAAWAAFARSQSSGPIPLNADAVPPTPAWRTICRDHRAALAGICTRSRSRAFRSQVPSAAHKRVGLSVH